MTFSVAVRYFGDGSCLYSINCECGSLLQAETAGGLGLAIATHAQEHEEDVA